MTSWYENPIDLPGRWYLQAIEQLFKENRLAKGELRAVFHVLPQDAPLVGDILKPMDEFVASADKLALLGCGRHAGIDEHRRATSRNIVDRASERLGAAIDMDDDRLRAGCQCAQSCAQFSASISLGQVTTLGTARPSARASAIASISPG